MMRARMPRRWPQWLMPSARVDLALILAGARATLRTEFAGPVSGGEVKRWARGLGLYATYAKDGYVALSTRPGAARRLLALDESAGAHEFALGRMLGYPPCCCAAASRVGEGGIDAWAVRSRRPRGRLTDVARYAKGIALISHVPCRPWCHASQMLAAKAAKVNVDAAHKLRSRQRTRPLEVA